MNNRITLAAIILAAACGLALADSFSGRLMLYPDWTHSKVTGASTVTETFDSFVDWTHTSGTNANQMNTIVRETTTLTNSESKTINLAGGVTDSFGDATTFVTVRFLCLSCPTSNTNNITMGGGTNSWASWCGGTNNTLTVRPGGAIMLLAPDVTGYAVTDAALTMLNDGTNSTTYSLYIGGSE